MKKREILAKNKLFQLVRQQRDHKTWYEIQLYAVWSQVPESMEDELIAYFGKTTVKYTKTWRFWNRIEAHKQFTYAALRWC